MSVYISNLPEYTGNTYNGYIIWNDSGETTTYKTRYLPVFKPGNGTNNIVSIYNNESDTAGSNNFVVGSGNAAAGGNNYSVVLGGINNTLTSNASGNYSAIIASTNVNCYFGRFVAIGCDNMSGQEAGFAFGTSSSRIGGGGCVIGGSSNLLSNSNGERQHIMGAANTQFNGSFYRDTAVFGGNGVRIFNNGSASSDSKGQFLGAFNTTIEKTNTPDNATKVMYPLVIGGQSNKIWGDDITIRYNPTIISGSGSTLQDVEKTTMLNCWDTTITGGTNVVAIGLSGDSISPTDNTTYTQNHASLGQSYQGYFDNGSGSTFTIDWNKGNTQRMSWDASGGTITCNNTQTGAHYRMIINNPSGHAPSSFSVSGRTIKFNGGSFVVYSGESICELFITDDSVFVNQLGLFS